MAVAAFVTFCYLSTLILSILTILVAALMIWKAFSNKPTIFPKALRLYLRVCLLPFIFAVCLSTGIISFCWMISYTPPFVIEFFSILLSFSCQMIRNSFLLIMMERIVASIFWKTYTAAHGTCLFWLLTIVSFVITFLYIGTSAYHKYISHSQSFFLYLTYYIFAMHILSSLICIILFFVNKRMYKLTAYKICLKERHQILENVKIITFLFPTILIHTIISPFGSLLAIIDSFFDFLENNPALLTIFYNLALLLICIRHIYIYMKKAADVKISVVKNAFGKILPTHFTADNYFQGLQQQWKK